MAIIVVFESHLDEIKRMTNDCIDFAMESIGEAAESHAKEYVTDAVYKSPESWYLRTGNLRNRITHTTIGDGTTETAVVGSNVSYAPYVELGTGIYAKGPSNAKHIPWTFLGSDGKFHTTSGVKPRPFIRPAMENHLDEYKQILREAFVSMRRSRSLWGRITKWVKNIFKK